MPRRDKDYSEIRAKVQKAALLIIEHGTSEKKAAWIVGLPKASLQRYLKKGKLPDGLPIWPNNPAEQLTSTSEDNGPHDNYFEGTAGDSIGPHDLAPGPLNGHPQNQHQESGPQPKLRAELRTENGQFAVGNSMGGQRNDTKEAKALLAAYCPIVADTLIKVFGMLPLDRPDLILAFGKEILDRGMGKSAQAVNVDESAVSAEYQYFQAVIRNGDIDTIREMQDLAIRMENYARDNDGASSWGQMAILPPPGGTLRNLDRRDYGTLLAPDNTDTSEREE